MKKNILFFYCLLVVTVVSLKAQEIRSMPADSAYGVVHISVCNMRDEGKFTSGMSTQALLGMPVKVLQYTGWYEIQTPDDYTGWVHRMVITPMSKEQYDEWNRAEKIVVTSHYGLVRTVLFMHDIIIPRDASQQAYVGERIEIAPDFSNVQRGDLVFFGRKATADRKEGISHVGIYLGNKRFIHALGDVHVSSFDPEDEYYDEFNTGRLLFATRFLPYINKEKGMNTTDHNPYYLYD